MKQLEPIPHGILLAASALALLAPAPARALSCGRNVPQYPPDGAVAVPTDTLLWGHSQSPDSIVSRLIGPAGKVAVEEQDVAVEPIPGLRLPALVPLEELEANTTYTIETTLYSGGPITFTTGPGPAGDAAPPPPTWVASKPVMGEGYYGDPSRWVSLEFAPHEGILVGEGRDLQSGSKVSVLSDDNVLSMGVGACPSWPDGAADRIDGRFGVLDGAGNFSGWVEMPVEIPSEAEAVEAIRAQRAAAIAATATDDPVTHEADCSFARGSAPGRWMSFAFGLVAASALGARRKLRRG